MQISDTNLRLLDVKLQYNGVENTDPTTVIVVLYSHTQKWPSQANSNSKYHSASHTTQKFTILKHVQAK